MSRELVKDKAAEADLIGCYCELCVSGEGNPDNPRCTCSPLSVEESEQQ